MSLAKVKQYILITLLLLTLTLPLAAQRLQVRSFAEPSTVGRDEEIVFTIEITGRKGFKADAPKLPEMKDLSYRSMMSSSSTSFSIINGSISESVTRSFIYRLIPRRTGNLVIPSFNIKIEGQVYTTQQVNIRVLEIPRAGTTPSQPGSPSGGRQSMPLYMPDPFDLGISPVGDIEIVAIPEKRSVFLGEPLLVTYRLYTTQPVSALEIRDEKDFGGYGKEQYSEPNRLNFETVMFRNQRYKSAVIKVMAISPNRTGSIELPQLTAEVQLGTIGLYSNTLQNDKVSIKVNELPVNGRPHDFSGAVGTFRVSEDISKTTLRVGEAYEYKLTITGRGNFNQFSNPEFALSEEFRITAPNTENQLRAGIEGTRVIKYILIPRREGRFTLPGVTFNWFDPIKGTYQNFRGKQQVIEVKPGNVLTFISNVFQKENIRTLSQLKTLNSYSSNLLLFNNLLYWFVVLFVILSLVPSWLIAKTRKLKELDPELAARRSSAKVLKKYLKQAEMAAKNGSTEFYPKAEQGLMRYLSDKYHIPQRFSNNEKIYHLHLKGLNENTIQQLELFLKRCTEVRFMPGGFNAADLLKDLSALNQLIRLFTRKSF